MVVAIRKRRGIASSVVEYSGGLGEVLRLVTVEYSDGKQPFEEQVLWEREKDVRVFEARSFPNVLGTAPDESRAFESVQTAARWQALSPYITVLDGGGNPKLVTSPLFGAIQAEDFQLVPLVRALEMPRISLLLADDVGLGKSIEAGLILSELIRRRRIRKVLVLCPAALRFQWQKELKSKFGLSFDIVDRAETHSLQKQLGMDASPWRAFQRVITSLHYLKQPDVLEQFLSLCRHQGKDSASLPWDLLILDEAHNCMPSRIGEDSDLAKMIQRIAPYFEHRLFLTATPHNGYTHSFSGLLEQLDPVRFTQTDEFDKTELTRISQIVIRRLKSEVNAQDRELNRPERFANRFVNPLNVTFSHPELALMERFAEFRKKIRSVISSLAKGEQYTGFFAVEILNKRLLSCPFSFADSWSRFKEGLDLESVASDSELLGARRAVEEDLDDDAELEGRLSHASRMMGAWLQRCREQIVPLLKSVDEALVALGLSPFSLESSVPTHDSRIDHLIELIQTRIRTEGQWAVDERLIVFTEYKTTLDYLNRRLLAAFPKDSTDRIRLLYGGMPDATARREEIKEAFNDPENSIRLLLATDSASEGQNLQETARLLLHWDIPWNPSRLDQRNGRLDRHGQARDVHIFHFTSDHDADLKFLGRILEKVEQIRTDLGSVSELFDTAFTQHFYKLQPPDLVDSQLSLSLENVRRRTRAIVPTAPVSIPETQLAVDWLKNELGYSPARLKSVLESAFNISGSRLLGPDDQDRVRLPAPIPPEWRGVIDDDVRLPGKNGEEGPLPYLSFNPENFVQVRNGRPVFRPSKDAAILHLGHPLIHRALLRLSRARYPGTEESARCSRWSITQSTLPAGVEALFIVTVEELANNELRESFHHWCRSLRFQWANGTLEGPGTHVPKAQDSAQFRDRDLLTQDHARNLWLEAQPDLEHALDQHRGKLTSLIQTRLKSQLAEESREQKQLFSKRLAEIERELAREEKHFQKRFEDLRKIQEEQPDLFQEDLLLHRPTPDDLKREVDRHREHHSKMKVFLAEEQQRVLERILPRRFALRGEVLVLPVSVEIRLPLTES